MQYILCWKTSLNGCDVWCAYRVNCSTARCVCFDYVNELTNVCNQAIEFGKNIIDMTMNVRGEDVYTALIPLGAKKESTDTTNEETYEKRLTISSLADSTDGTIKKVGDYIYDTEAVKQWGFIWKVVKFDDVTNASNLLSKAKSELRNSIDATLSIEVTAIDLHLLDVDIDTISVGDLIQCLSLPHNLNVIMVVKKIDIDIDNPANTKINLSLPNVNFNIDKTITSNNNDNKNDIEHVKNELNEEYPTYDVVDNKFNDFGNDLKDWVSENFYPATGGTVDLSDYAKKDDVDAKMNELKDWTNTNYPSKTDLSEYAKIVDVNTAFNELATALEGV